ncbi:MAG: hypothetical protein H7210_02200 [Pyrinomonadaceae bacterium]|nr:hypothetical protein [Phycisphaerales bacterium]
MIATMAILAVVMTVTSMMLWTATSGFSAGSMSDQLHTDASMSLERIVREFRGIPRKPASFAPDITSVTSTAITWNTNSTLTLTGTNLMLRELGGPSRLLLADVSSLSLRCYDESNTALPTSLAGSSCDAVRRISITLTLRRSGVLETARTKVFIRSLTPGA